MGNNLFRTTQSYEQPGDERPDSPLHHGQKKILELTEENTLQIELTRQSRRDPFGLQLRWGKEGLVICNIIPNSVASRYLCSHPDDTFSPGDVIVDVNGHRTQREMDKELNGDSVYLTIYLQKPNGVVNANTIGVEID